MSRRPPPKKKAGKATGPRRLDGVAMDIATTAATMGESPKATRSQIARGLIPHHRLGGRIIVLREELFAFLRQLPGVSVEDALANVKARFATVPR